MQVRRCTIGDWICEKEVLGADQVSFWYHIVAHIAENRILIKLVSHLVPKISTIENTPSNTFSMDM